jgi:hypothetical protein
VHCKKALGGRFSTGIEKFGVFEAIGPEVTVSIEAAIEPFGVFAVDVLHESRDVETFVVELFPGSLEAACQARTSQGEKSAKLKHPVPFWILFLDTC